MSANLNYFEKTLRFVGDSDLPGDKIDVDFSRELELFVWLFALPVVINVNGKGRALN